MKYSHIIILLLFIHSCEAPRNNPLDPSNPDNIYHTINGFIKSQETQRKPISNVSLFWKNQNIITKTDTNGFYSIEIIEPENGWLYCEQEGFWEDSTKIVWEKAKYKSADFFLNSIASPDSLKIFSIVLNRHGTFPTEKISVEISVNDLEKDVDSIYVSIPIKNVRNMLDYNVADKKYGKEFSLYQMNSFSLEELVGQKFDIDAKENYRTSQIITSGTLKRIIWDEVEFISPSNGETTSQTPILKWKNFNSGFEFSYKLEIYTIETFPQLIWSKEKVVKDSTSYTVDTNLNADDYFWVIWAVDEFGNRSRSKPASFKVE